MSAELRSLSLVFVLISITYASDLLYVSPWKVATKKNAHTRYSSVPTTTIHNRTFIDLFKHPGFFIQHFKKAVS